ncbi:hypothetical protein [Cellvibrio sp. pealriver]|uniref:hypothetical protein n=1 Tax=Cellvibrio sp. pealriver TaxID=1622269 RepID=UPI00066FB885|nr:hypothetical protein [Cellvibrio sp. pealriver]
MKNTAALSLLLLLACANASAIEIEGTPKYKKQVEACLGLLERKASAEYEFIRSHIGIIAQNKRSGMRAWEVPPRYQMSDTTAFYSVTWCAGTIAHDAYHSYLYKKHAAINGENNGNGEKPAYELWGGKSAEKEAIEFQLKVMKKIGASAHEINYLTSLDGTHGDANSDGKLDGEDYKQRNW